MQSPNHRPGKLDTLSQYVMCKQAIPACRSLDKLSQHAISQLKSREARHTIPTCSGSHSQIGKARHTIPAYTPQACYPSMHCKNWLVYKRLQKPRTVYKLTQQQAVQLEEPEQEEQQSKQLHHHRRLGNRCET